MPNCSKFKLLGFSKNVVIQISDPPKMHYFEGSTFLKSPSNVGSSLLS